MNYDFITTKAYETLISQKITSLPADPLKFKIPNTTITSYQNYAQLTNIDVNEIMNNDKYKDGYIVFSKKNNLILYNENSYEPRKKFTLYHEIGHLSLKHKHQNKENEAEANFFASQILIPNVIIKDIIKRGYNMTKDKICKIFQVSPKAAEIRLEYLTKYMDKHPNQYDDILLQIFSDYLNANFPNLNTNDDFLELDEKRKSWY